MDATESKSSRRVYLIVFSTYLISFTNDAAISWSSPVLPQLRLRDPQLNPLGRRLSENEESWLGSLLSLGYVVGLIVYSYLCYKFGRKYTLTSLGVVHVIGFLLFTTKSLTCFFIGRFLNGVASGVGLIIFPMYITEICKDRDRGFLLVSRQVFSSCGTLFVYIAGNYLSLFWFNIILSIFPMLFVISFAKLATESPYFYVMNNDLPKARKMYFNVFSIKGPQAEEEIDEIQKTIEMSQSGSLKETLKSKPALKATCLVFFMFIFQHLTGYMAFATYTEEIVGSSQATIFVGVVLLIGSAASTLLIDKRGRKPLLYISLIGIIFAEVVFSGLCLYFPLSNLIPAIFIVTFFLLYNVGIAFLPQIISAEILPLSIKFKIASAAGVLGWGAAFIITKTFFKFWHVFGLSWIILLFAMCSTVYLAIVGFCLPETTGRSFRQIQSLLEVDVEMKE